MNYAQDIAHLEKLKNEASGIRRSKLAKQLELLRQAQHVAALPEPIVTLVDVGTRTPEAQMACIVAWRNSLRQFLAT